ncbi:MAG: hypothetical protein JWP25_1562 [Bradyrhizobium sp.]|nr:hypothetical protein [Bradyrhizobium sp.]
MFRKTVIALLAAASGGMLTPAVASAHGSYTYYGHLYSDYIYDAYNDPFLYGYDDGGCHFVPRRVRTGYDWSRPVQVCGLSALYRRG